MEVAGIDKRTEFNPTQVLCPISEIISQRRESGAVSSRGIVIQKAVDDCSRWLEACDADIAPDDRQRARSIKRELRRREGLVTETYSQVAVSEALQRLAARLSRRAAATESR